MSEPMLDYYGNPIDLPPGMPPLPEEGSAEDIAGASRYYKETVEGSGVWTEVVEGSPDWYDLHDKLGLTIAVGSIGVVALAASKLSRLKGLLSTKMNRRSFQANAVRVGGVGALSVLVASIGAKKAVAIYCYWQTDYNYAPQCRTSSSCCSTGCCCSTWRFQRQVCGPPDHYTGFAQYNRIACGC